MARIRIELPATFRFTCTIPVRITDINYGGHAGNDTILSLIHEARMQFLTSMGYSEMDVDGVGLIMTDAAIEFKKELFYGEQVSIHVTAGAITRIGFDLYYKLEKKNGAETAVVAHAKTGMVCFDYSARKVAAIPESALVKLRTD